MPTIIDKKTCSKEQVADYLRVTSTDFSKYGITKIFFDIGNFLNNGPISHQKPDGSILNLEAQPLNKKMKKVFEEALKYFANQGIVLHTLNDLDTFMDQVQMEKRGGYLVVRVAMVKAKDIPVTLGGAASTHPHKIPELSRKDFTFYTGSITLNEDYPNPLGVLLHEIAHVFGVGHMGQNFNSWKADCMTDKVNGLTLTQRKQLDKNMGAHNCIVRYDKCESLMFCAPHPNCLKSSNHFSPGDEVVVQEQYNKMIGKTNSNPGKSINPTPKKRVEFLQFCPPEINTTDCIKFSPYQNHTGLRHRIKPENLDLPEEGEAVNYSLDLHSNSIADQPWYAELSNDAYKAFIAAFALSLSNELVKYTRFKTVTKMKLELAIETIITITIYGLPITIFSFGMERATEALISYLKKNNPDKAWLVPYIKPFLPILLNTFYNFYLTKELHKIIQNVGSMTLSLTTNILSGLVGGIVGRVSGLGLHTLCFDKEKQD